MIIKLTIFISILVFTSINASKDVEQIYGVNIHNINSSSIGDTTVKLRSTINYTYNQNNMKIAFIGDIACSDNSKSAVVIDSIKKEDPDLVILLGDLRYPKPSTNGSIDCMIDEWADIREKTFITLGNHDYCYANLGKPRILTCEDQAKLERFFDIPANGVYAVRYGDVIIVFFDSKDASIIRNNKESNIWDGDNSTRIIALDNLLEEIESIKGINWKIMATHFNPYMNGGNSFVRDILHPRADKYGYDFVFTGNVHNYQRTYPLLYNPTKPNDPIILDEYDFSKDKHGTIFTISGAGVNLYNVGNEEYIAEKTDVFYGYTLLKTFRNQTHAGIMSQFVKVLDADGREVDGIFDPFIVTKIVDNNSNHIKDDILTINDLKIPYKGGEFIDVYSNTVWIEPRVIDNSFTYNTNCNDLKNPCDKWQMETFTIATWVLLLDNDVKNDKSMISAGIKGDGNLSTRSVHLNYTNFPFQVGMDANNHVFALYEREGGGNCPPCFANGKLAGGKGLLSSSRIDDGIWHHIAYTLNKTGDGYDAKLYIDGITEDTSFIPLNTNDINNAPTPSEFPIQIGASWIDKDRCACIMDELFIYNYTLSSQEITDLMNYKVKNNYLIGIRDNKDQLYVSNKQPSDYIIINERKVCVEYNTIMKGDPVLLMPECNFIQDYLKDILKIIYYINRIFL